MRLGCEAQYCNASTAAERCTCSGAPPRGRDDEGTGWTAHAANTNGTTVGQTLVAAATGTVKPLFVTSGPNRSAGAYMWVSADDQTRWAAYQDIYATSPRSG